MPLLILVLFLLIFNWIFSYFLGIIPIILLHSLSSIFWTCLGIVLLIIISWFFGD